MVQREEESERQGCSEDAEMSYSRALRRDAGRVVLACLIRIILRRAGATRTCRRTEMGRYRRAQQMLTSSACDCIHCFYLILVIPCRTYTVGSSHLKLEHKFLPSYLWAIELGQKRGLVSHFIL